MMASARSSSLGFRRNGLISSSATSGAAPNSPGKPMIAEFSGPPMLMVLPPAAIAAPVCGTPSRSPSPATIFAAIRRSKRARVSATSSSLSTPLRIVYPWDCKCSACAFSSASSAALGTSRLRAGSIVSTLQLMSHRGRQSDQLADGSGGTSAFPPQSMLLLPHDRALAVLPATPRTASS